jgi:hypothetical protein
MMTAFLFNWQSDHATLLLKNGEYEDYEQDNSAFRNIEKRNRD